MKKIKLLALIALTLVVVISGACTSSSTTTPATVYTTPPGIGDVETTITNSPTTVDVNFLVRSVQRSDSAPSAIIYYMDVDPPTTQGQTALTATGTYVMDTALDEPVNWKNVSPGPHTFSAQLVNANDNTPFNPPVIVTNTIVVPASDSTAPEISRMTCIVTFPNPSPPTPSPEPVAPFMVQITGAVHHFRLNDDAIGKENVAGEGHFIYYLDAVPPIVSGLQATTGAGTFKSTTNDFQTWEEVGAGEHSFYIQVVNNDNTPLDLPLIAWYTITLPENL